MSLCTKCTRNTAGLFCLLAASTAAAKMPVSGPQEEVVVVGTKTERPRWSVPAPVTVITPARMNAEQTQTLGEISRYEPALDMEVDTPRFGGTGLAIRGVGGNRIALEFDGVPLPQQFSVGAFADSSRLTLDPALLRRVEILRGPASALYGSDAIGGVMVMESVDAHELVEPGRQHYVGGNAGYFGSNGSGLGQATYAYANGSDGVVGSFSYRSGNEPDNEAQGVPDDRVEFDQWEAFGKWTHAFDAGGELRASADYFRRQTDSEMFAQLGYGRQANSTSLTGDDEQHRWRGVLDYTLPPLPWIDEGNVMLYRQDNITQQGTEEVRNGPPRTQLLLDRRFKIRERGYGGELRLRKSFTTGPLTHIVVGGAEWDEARMSEARQGRQLNLRTGASTNVLLGERFPLRDMPITDSTETGVYAQDEIVFGRFGLVGGLRWDRFELDARTDDVFTDPARLTDLDNDDVSFRVGSTLRLAEQLGLYVNYAEGFRAPPAADVNLYLDLATFNYRAIPNPDLRPERSRNIEGGLRFDNGSTRFEAGAYSADYDDFIESRARLGVDAASGALIFQSRNIEEASIYGVETDISQKLDVLWPRLADFSVEASAHWAHGTNDRTDQPLNTVSPLKAVFALRWQRPTLGADLRVTHHGRQQRTDFTAGPFFVPPARTLVDTVLHWTPRRGIDCHLGVYNLSDQRFWSYQEVRHFAPDDPRVEIASWAGTYANFTVSLHY